MKLLPAFTSFIIFIFIAHFCEAQEVFSPTSRSQSLAGISVCLKDSWSVFGNQAGLAQINRPIIGTTFQNHFLVKELSTGSAFIILPVQSSVFGFSFYQFGKTVFRQQKLGIAFARSLSPRLHAGLQFNYYSFFMPEDNKLKGTYGVEIGFQYQWTKNVRMGIHALNPIKTGIKTFSYEYDYPTRYRLGTLIQLSGSFAFMAEAEKQLLNPMVIIKSGLEYEILKTLVVRTGVSGKPYQLSAGMGFEVKKLKIDLAVAYNQYLGNSPSASLQYQF